MATANVKLPPDLPLNRPKPPAKQPAKALQAAIERAAPTAPAPAPTPPAAAVDPEAPAEELGSFQTTEQLLELLLPMDPTPLPTSFCVHADVRFSIEQSTTLRKIAIALDRRGAKTDNGQRVTNISGALRYIIEEAGRSIPAPPAR